MSIEERTIKASEHYKQDIVRFKIPTFPQAYEDGYIEGATEQREIDIKKAQDIHCSFCDLYGHCELVCSERESIRKAMMED